MTTDGADPGDRDEPGADGPPAFGPSGYLPERASKRARKIVLRAPLGMQWVWAAIVAGAIVLVAGLLFLSRADDGPRPPFEPVGPLVDVANGEVRTVGGERMLLVTEGGRPRAFDVGGFEDAPAFCPASRRLETPDGVWSLTGRGHGTPSLAEFPTIVSADVLYVDPTTTDPGPPPSAETRSPDCHS